jgi:poly(A) polymerase Pap1
MEMDDLPLVAKKYSTYYGTEVVKDSHLLTSVCRQQLGLIIGWCLEQGVECFEDTHRHMIVHKNLEDRIDEFVMAKNDFFKSVGVNTIDEMNEFSQGWDGLSVSNMNELVIKVDQVDDLEVAITSALNELEEVDEGLAKVAIRLNV